MGTKTFSFILTFLLFGTALGYGSGYLVSQPQINNLNAQVTNLNGDVSGLKQTVAGQQNEISAQAAKLTSLETERTDLQTKLNSTRIENQALQARSDSLENQLSNSSSQISTLEKRTSDILGILVLQEYQWSYQGRNWVWNLEIPLAVEVQYREKSRPRSGTYYVNMAKDPGDDLYIEQLVQRINTSAQQAGYSELQKLNFVIAFVQSLPYTVDKETSPYDEYPRYPVETLFDRGGDCEDTSILIAAILDKMGYDTALLLLRDAQHMAVGISTPIGRGSYHEYQGKRYYYLETTGDGWQIGQIPPDFSNVRTTVYPLRN